MISSLGSGMAGMSGLPRMDAVHQQRFSRADADGSGALDASEFAQALQQRGVAAPSGSAAPAAGELFAKLDANGDGGLTQQEMQQGVQQEHAARWAAGTSTVQAFGSESPWRGRCAAQACDSQGTVTAATESAGAKRGLSAAAEQLRLLIEQISRQSAAPESTAASLHAIA